MGHSILAYIDLFQAGPGHYPHLQERPPCRDPVKNYRNQILSTLKTMAMKNPTESRALFNEIKHNHFKTTTIAYTYGPVNKSNERTTIAVTIPSLDIEEANRRFSRNWLVYTAEAEAIIRSMELIYHLDDQVTN